MPPPATTPSLRVVQISDTHLAPDVPYADDHWRAVAEYVASTRPDLVVHTGDVTLNGAAEPGQLAYAHARLAELAVPWLVVPGNHDIGDTDDPDHPLDEERRAHWIAVFGADHWSLRAGGWRLIGVDVQTLAARLPVAAELTEWLADELSRPGPAALFLHRPLRPWDGAHDEPRRYVREPLRSQLTDRLTPGVRLVGSGHVHQFLARRVHDVHHVWAPSTWAVIPDRVQPVLGAKRTGLVEHRLAADGGVTSTFVRPPGLADVVIGDDFASPYHH